MTSKEQLRKQADFVSERYKKLNDDFLVMFGYLIYEHLEEKDFNKSEISSLKSKAMLRTRQVKSDLKKIFANQYKENNFKQEMDDYMIMFPSVLDDIQNQIGITITKNGKREFVGIDDIYKLFDGDMESLAKQAADSGLRVYQDGMSYRLDSYIRYCALKGIKDINSQVQEILFEKMGANGWEIDYHANPRPSHAYMGGRQFVVGKARTINGIYFESFEEIALPRLIEPNCLHFKIPIVCGVSKPLHTTEQLAQWRKADQAKVKYAERTYTKYEATQVQKRLADEIRKCDDRLTVASSARLEYLRRVELSKRRVLFKEYDKFSKACGLERKIKNR